jgi:hypothetical protein
MRGVIISNLNRAVPLAGGEGQEMFPRVARTAAELQDV